MLSDITITTWISIGALALSVLAFLNTLRTASFNRRLLSLEKRNSLMSKLAEALLQLEEAKSAIEMAYEAVPTCPAVPEADRAFVRVEISASREKLAKMHQRLGKLSHSVSPIKIQQIAPDFDELLCNMTELARKAQRLAAKCPECPKRSGEQCEIFGKEQSEGAKS